MPLIDSPEAGNILQKDQKARPGLQKLSGGFRIPMLILILILAAVLAGMWAQQVQWPLGEGSVTGSVVDEAGNPVVGADVFISGIESWERVNQDGSFVFDGIPAGERTLVVVVTPGPVDSEVMIPLQIEAGMRVDLGEILFDDQPVPTPGGDE